MRKFSLACLLLVIGAALLPAQEIVINTVVLEDDVIAGVGAVDLINDVAINNSGDTLVETNTDAGIDDDELLLFNGDLLIQEGNLDSLESPSDTVVSGFASADLNNSGQAALHLFINGPGPAGTGVFIGGLPLVLAADASTAADVSPGTTYAGVFDAKNNDSGDVMAIMLLNDPGDPTTDAIVRFDANGVQTIVAREGDTLPGQTEVVEEFGSSENLSAFNNAGDVLYIAEMAGDSLSDVAIYLNDTIVAQEGMASPVAGRDYMFLVDRGLDLSNNDNVVFRATLTGDTSSNETIILNGNVFVQEGDPVPVPGNFVFTNFGTNLGSINVSDRGDVLYFAQWNGNTDTNSGLFLNDTLLVQEGVTTIDGLVVDTIQSGTSAFSMSDNGQWVIFEATLAGGLEGAFTIEISQGDVLIGDVNQDGIVNFLDISPFIGLLSSGMFLEEADVNLDGMVDFLDINPFIVLLSGG